MAVLGSYVLFLTGQRVFLLAGLVGRGVFCWLTSCRGQPSGVHTHARMLVKTQLGLEDGDCSISVLQSDHAHPTSSGLESSRGFKQC